MPVVRHHSQKRRSSSPPAYERSHHRTAPHTSERHRSGSQRFENDSRRPTVRRSPSPPMAFRRDSSAYSHSSSFRSRGVFPSRPRPFSIRAYRSSAVSRFSTRDRRSSSPSGFQHSFSTDRGRIIRGAARASRRADFIGSFGRPIYYQPTYEVSPDRTTEDKLPDKPEEVVEDRDELFNQMMEAKRSENLDDYYRLRDLLNAFDRRNPHLAFRGSGRVSRRKLSVSPERNGKEKRLKIEREGGKSDNGREGKSAVLGEELEEVDCTDKNDNGSKAKNKEMVADITMEQISNEDLEREDNYDDFGYDEKSANKDDIYCGDIYEEENAVDLDFMEDEIVEEEIQITSERLKPTSREKTKDKINIKKAPIFRMFRPEFIPILISSLRKGAVIASSTNIRGLNGENSQAAQSDAVKVTSRDEPEIIDSNTSGHKRGRKPKKNKEKEQSAKTSPQTSELNINNNNLEELQSKEPSQIPTLLEIALCRVIAMEINTSKKL